MHLLFGHHKSLHWLGWNYNSICTLYFAFTYSTSYKTWDLTAFIWLSGLLSRLYLISTSPITAFSAANNKPSFRHSNQALFLGNKFHPLLAYRNKQTNRQFIKNNVIFSEWDKFHIKKRKKANYHQSGRWVPPRESLDSTELVPSGNRKTSNI